MKRGKQREITDEKILKEANEYINKNVTVRQMEKDFNRSKSQIHKDITEYLEKIDLDMHKKVKKKALENIRISRIKGGKSKKKRRTK